MQLTGSLARAARALVKWPRAHVAMLSAIDENMLADFESGIGILNNDAKTRLLIALEEGGAIFIAEDQSGGVGVRLKFNKKDVNAINRMEGEGGPVGDDDV